MRIAKKISPKELSLAIGESAIVAGIVRSSETVESQMGDSIKFIGSFGAVVEHIENGKTLVDNIRSGVMYVPSILEGILEGMVQSGLDAAGDAYQGTEFAFKLFKVKDTDERNARGYKWGVETLREPSEASDPVSKILLVHKAPETETESETESEVGTESSKKNRKK